MFDSVQIRSSGNKGRGVFAARTISKGETISVSYSWTLSPEDLMLYEKTSLGGYWFDHPELPGYGLVPIGTAALVNHDRPGNADLRWRASDIGYIGTLVASMDILQDQEILIDYGPGIDY